jgi:anti-sigma factor RsiW
MECLPESTLLAYSEGELGAEEAFRVRSHISCCRTCRETAARYEALAQALARPPLHEPPARLVPQVIARLYPAAAPVAAIIAVIAASFVFLICWIYVYFDFSGNSLGQALNLTAAGASGWLAGAVKGAAAVYNYAQAARKACAAMLRIPLPIPLGFIFTAMTFSGIAALTLLRPRLRKVK